MYRERVNRGHVIPVRTDKLAFAHESERKLCYEAGKETAKEGISNSNVKFNNLKADRDASKRISIELLEKVQFFKETIRDLE